MAEHRRGSSALHRIRWYRLVLDEGKNNLHPKTLMRSSLPRILNPLAHTIRNCSSKQFKALNSIQSHIRWCLTGTPIQNSLEDLGSLVCFLGMPLFNEPATFRKYVAMVRLRQGSDTAEFENLRLILSSICLRRSRSILPNEGYTTEVRRPTLTAREHEQYQTLEQSCKRAIQIGNKRHGDDRAHHRVMEALLRLRMFCNNGPDPRGTLITSQVGSRPDEILSFFQQSGEAMCVYCSVDILSLGPPGETESGYLTPCQRLLCGECTGQYTNSHKDGSQFRCSLCHQKHEVDGSVVDKGLESTRTSKYPSKVTALVKDVERHYLAEKW